MRAVVLGHIPRYAVRFHIQFAVLVIPDMLRRQVHLYIGAGQVVLAASLEVIRVAPGVGLQIDRLALYVLSGFNVLPQLLDLVVNKDRIAVVVKLSIDRNLPRQRGLKRPLAIPGAVLRIQFIDEGRDLFIAERRFPVLEVHELCQREKVHFHRLIAEFIRDSGALIGVDGLHPTVQFRIVSVHRGFFAEFPREFVASLQSLVFLQRLMNAFSDKILQVLIADLIPLHFRLYLHAVLFLIIVKDRVFRPVPGNFQIVGLHPLSEGVRLLRLLLDHRFISVKYALQDRHPVLLLRGVEVRQILVELVPVDFVAVKREIAGKVRVLLFRDRDHGVRILVKNRIFHFLHSLSVHTAAIHIGSLQEPLIDALTVISVSVISACSDHGTDREHGCQRDP